MKNLEDKLLSTISDKLVSQGDYLLSRNISSEIEIESQEIANRDIIDGNIIVGNRAEKSNNADISPDRMHSKSEPYAEMPSRHSKRANSKTNVVKYLVVFFIIFASILSFITPSNVFNSYLNEYNNTIATVFIAIGIIVFVLLSIFFIRLLIKATYKHLENKFETIDINNKREEIEFNDTVYKVIANTFETLSEFKTERERQAKTSYNAALLIIILGTLIIFLGVYLLFNNSILSGTFTSGIGGVSNIIGGTIWKFYKDTNNRMDAINNDLFILNSSKIQYALILKITDESERNQELQKLILSIGNITRP